MNVSIKSVPNPSALELANQLTKWVEAYAIKVCPEGCLPTQEQHQEITLFANIVRALNAIDENQRNELARSIKINAKLATAVVAAKMALDNTANQDLRERAFEAINAATMR